jgi:hypothetical protein
VSGLEEDVLFDCLEREVQAWKMLHDPELLADMRTGTFMSLMRQAGYSEGAVQKAGTAHYNDRLDREVPP